MTETFLDFEARSGATYDPPKQLTARCPRFESWESCNTLFRSPGPGAIRAYFEGTLEQLAHSDAPLVWMSDAEHGTSPAEAEHFGVLAVLQPFHLQVCKTPEKGSFLGLNTALRSRTTSFGLGRDAVVWVPPSAIGRGIRWAHIRDKRDAEAHFGPHMAAERSQILARIDDYLAEVQGLQAANVGWGDVPWYSVERLERQALLERNRVPSRWTART